MALTLHLPPELERSLREEARHAGVDAETFVLEAVQSRLQQRQPHPVLPRAEAELLEKINEGFPEDFWARYRYLIARREQEALTPEEQAELIALSDRVEARNVQRLGYLVELARLRGVSVTNLMDQLGIGPVPVS